MVSVLYSTTTIKVEVPIATTRAIWTSFGSLFTEDPEPSSDKCPRKKRDPDYEARLERIGDILARGAARLLARERREREIAAKEAAADISELTQEEEKVLHLVEKFGSISPAELGDHLDLSRATVARRTAGLKQRGLLRSDGKTSALKFYLTTAGRGALSSSNLRVRGIENLSKVSYELELE